MLRTMLVTLAAITAPLAAQSITTIPQFDAEGLRETTEIDIVGNNGGGAARWRESVGITNYPGEAFAIQAINPSGLSFAGRGSPGSTLRAYRYNILTGWLPIPNPPATAEPYWISNAFDISDNGVDVVGFVLFASDVTANSHAYRWSSQTGVTEYSQPGSGEESVAFAISGNGARSVGMFSAPGEIERAVYWDVNHVRSAPLTPFSPTSRGRARAVSQDGTKITGSFGSDAFVWTDFTGMTLLPSHPEIFVMEPTGISDDGAVIVGNGFGSDPGWIWTFDLGTRLFVDVAAQLMLDSGPSPVPFQRVKAISDDGLRIMGTQPNTDLFKRDTAWVIELPSGGIGTWTDLGNGVSTITPPTLSGFGALAANTPGELRLTGFPLLTTANLVLGFSTVFAPFKGGVLVPTPDQIFPLSTPFGFATLPFTWPSAVPSGAAIYVQAWTPSTLGPAGFVASNGLEGVTP